MTTDKAAQQQNTLKRELLSAWQSFGDRYPDDDFYAFGLYTTDTASYCGAVACSEQGLESAADNYAEHYGSNFELHRQSLRWSIGDSPFFDEGLDMMPLTNELRALEPDPYSDGDESEIEASRERFFAAAFAAIKELDDEGILGTGQARERVILSVWLHDESHAMKLDAAAKLNCRPSVERYSAELEAGLDAFNKWRPIPQSQR
ncbi:DUF4303 domain-containing protein [Pseudoduganella sp. R-34]|uniref:DUF4303 domain-containing protein n=1 Tax=Pseudoduganella sp. R-34 TaxID=3404062 RepID=UPI003CF525B2